MRDSDEKFGQHSDQWFSGLCRALNGTAYLVPRRDPFFLNPSNSTGDIIQRLTGFTGSTAQILITMEKIFLYVDSRYTLQAQKQCPECVVVPCEDVLSELPRVLPSGTQWMLSPWVWTDEEMQRMQALAKKQSWTPVYDHDCLLDQIFDPNPLIACHDIASIDCGVSFQEKCQKIFTHTDERAWIVCKAADIAWLTQLRGHDQVYAPLFHAFLIVIKTDQTFSGLLYTQKSRRIKGLCPDIRIMDWSDLIPLPTNRDMPSVPLNQDLEHPLKKPLNIPPLDQNLGDNLDPCPSQPLDVVLDQSLVYDPKTTPYGLVRSSWVKGSFASLAKERSIKNAWERHHMAQAHVCDGIALTQFLHWASQLAFQAKPLLEHSETEWSAAEKLAEFRSAQPAYQGPSFPTISAMGPNSAMIHYTPSLTQCDTLTQGVYLVDSGGQYHFGTTDVTRTLWLGNPLEVPLKLKQQYTQVLQGHIHLSQMIFPKNTSGIQLDAIARSFLWQKGWDYAHSTGHGVACFGPVHESPPAIAPRAPMDPIQEHMIFSIEPGYYEENWGGIRLENLVQVIAHHNGLSLQPLTLAPFDRTLILDYALSAAHRDWLNAYHAKVYTTLVPFLPSDTQRWLYECTRPF